MNFRMKSSIPASARNLGGCAKTRRSIDFAVLFIGIIVLSSSAAGQSCLTPPSGLVGWWPGDSNESDIAGLNSASTVNAVSIVPGEVMDGFSFGANGYFHVPASTALASQKFTWVAWVKPGGAGPNNDAFGSAIVFNNVNQDADSVSLSWSATSNRFVFIFGDITTASGYITSKDTFAPGSFYSVAGTYDGNVFQLFVNGILEASATLSKTIAYSSSGWYFGGSNLFASYPRTWNGVIDEVQAFSRPLAQSELQAIYNAGSAGECKTSASITSTVGILPQLAFGGGWYTALYFTNTTLTPVSFMVYFIDDNGNPLTVAAVNGSSATVNLPGRGTASIQIPNSGALVQGYATVALPAGVTGYGVFRQSVTGTPDQEAVVPLSGVNHTTSTLLFDDTNNIVTGVSVVNLGSASVVNAIAYDSNGNILGSGTIPLSPNGKAAAALQSIIPATAGVTGSVDFTTTSGNVAALGLRFNGAAFTSIPTSNR